MVKSAQKSDLPPRPLNCFLLYRIDKQKEIVAKCSGANHRDISKIIAKWWKEATNEEKLPYVKKALEEKKKHAQLYPDYKYCPKKKTTPKRVYKRKTNSSFTSRVEENNRIMELIYDDVNSLENLNEVTIGDDCEKKACSKKDTAATIKIEEVESPKLSCTSPDMTSASSSPLIGSTKSFSTPSLSPVSCLSPESPWKSSPYSGSCSMVPSVESPCLSFSTRLPLQACSPVTYSLSSPTTGSSSCSTPEAVFSPTSYDTDLCMFPFNTQQQIYDSNYDMSFKELSTPTEVTLDTGYFVDLSSSTDLNTFNVQDSSDFTFGSTLNFDYQACCLNFPSQSESSHLPQYIDPSFIMKS